MILTVFVVLALISLTLIVIGLSKETETAQALVGFFLLFILSLTILNGTLEYKTGETERYQYGSNFTGLHWDYDYNAPFNNPQNDPYLFHRYTTDDYTTFQDQTLGFWLAVASAVGFIGTLFSLRNKPGED